MDIFKVTLWDHELEFYTEADLFSPRKADRGSMAMLKHVSFDKSDKVLDLGCGYGLVGISIASQIGPEQVKMVDIDKRAVAVAQENAQHNGLSHLEIRQSDALSALSEHHDFTLILSNPPYHSDFSVPKRFIEESFQHLVVGGRMVMVVKRLSWYKNKLTSVFGGVKIYEQDGYYILESIKKNKTPQPQKKKTIKNKHRKRLERTKKRQRHL